MSYHQFVASNGGLYGSFEVFHNRDLIVDCWEGMEERQMPPGWYWHERDNPGVLPDGNTYGPFDSEDDATADAQATGSSLSWTLTRLVMG